MTLIAALATPNMPPEGRKPMQLPDCKGRPCAVWWGAHLGTLGSADTLRLPHRSHLCSVEAFSGRLWLFLCSTLLSYMEHLASYIIFLLKLLLAALKRGFLQIIHRQQCSADPRPLRQYRTIQARPTYTGNVEAHKSAGCKPKPSVNNLFSGNQVQVLNEWLRSW